MPFPRVALYSQGENLHVALWPGFVSCLGSFFFVAQGDSPSVPNEFLPFFWACNRARSARNTALITRFLAMEGRSYVLSVSVPFRKEDVPKDTPHYDLIVNSLPTNEKGFVADGGSCICGPDGKYIIEPVVDKEVLLTATLDYNRVLQERQNFDLMGHYSRPDVFQMTFNPARQAMVKQAKL